MKLFTMRMKHQFFHLHSPRLIVHRFELKRFGATYPAWLITRYDDCMAFLKDNRITRDVKNVMNQEQIKMLNVSEDIDFVSDHMSQASMVRCVFCQHMIGYKIDIFTNVEHFDLFLVHHIFYVSCNSIVF